jgi:ABC-2 type transport system permease protein
MRSDATGAWTFQRSGRHARAILALIRRDFQIRRSYRVAFVLDLGLGFLNLLIYFFISRTFVDAQTEQLGGAPSYFAFALVGIALTSVIQAAATEVSTVLRQEQLTGTLEALVTQPISPAQLVLGLAALPSIYAMLRVALYLAIAALWLDVDFGQASWGGFLAVLTATAAAMVGIGILSCAVVLLVKRGEIIVGMVIFGMGLLGGAFFPVSVLPGWVEILGRVVPTRFAFDGARSAIFTGGDWSDDVAFLLLFAALVVPLSLLLFRQALAAARRTGSLGQY